MKSVKSLLLWEKWRPNKIEDIILLPRIRKHFEKGLTQNYIFYGHYGTGKTSLARILIGKYTKDKPFLEINSSLYTSIDVLRNDIEDFCKTTPIMECNSDIKYVFLDEFDGVSSQFQDAFKAFIEKYSKFGVRFIITTNHINKISDGIKSRITSLDFNCKSLEEEKYLKIEIFKKINQVILPKENKQIPKEELVSIINKNFPDFRSIMVELQNYLETGKSISSYSNASNKIKMELYNCIYNPSLSYESIYHFLMEKFGADNIHVMINLLGRPFIEWSFAEKKNIDKLFQCNYVVADYSSKLDTDTDPIVLGMTIIGKFRDILL
jgi:DNA polymerase III delta prime subunit